MHLRFRAVPFFIGCCLTLAWLSSHLFQGDVHAQPAESVVPLELTKADPICLIGNTLAERMQQDGRSRRSFNSDSRSMNW